MGFVLSILYFVTYYLTPVKVFGPLAFMRIELILALLLFFVSLPALTKTFILNTPQSIALVGLAIAVFFSVLIGMRWAGGATSAFQQFLPNPYGYFLVCLHCNSKRKLQILVLTLVFVCLFVIANGYLDLRHLPQDVASEARVDDRTGLDLWNMNHPYLLAMRSSNGDLFYRLRGPGEINDPNDFGQLALSVIPLVFIFWRAKKPLLNVACVLLPASVLLCGVFLTHSRGALLALMAMAIVAARRRIGTIPSLILAGGLFVVSSALHFTGGRDISADAGADRTALWGIGLRLLKSHPLFGVGFSNFGDYAGLTAHNSIVVCAGELGMFGLYFWSLFLFPSLRDALVAASREKVIEEKPAGPREVPFPNWAEKVETLDKAAINHLGRLAVLSLTGFLVSGLFLSRAYVLTLFLLCGFAEVVFEMGLSRGMIAPRLPVKRVLMYSGVLAIALVLLMYVMVRILNFVH